ncbi:MAG: class I SAM-dependent methyltransferase [Acidimicrobiales bacterium]
MSELTTYDTMGIGYAAVRKPDARLAAVINAALGGATTVVNIGAGTGGYEPSGRSVIAVEPSSMMLSQRSPGSAPAVQATAEALPLTDQCADAAMAVLTVAHWTDLGRGLDEMRQVARRVVIITVDPDVVSTLWIIADYVPEMIADVARLPAIAVVMDRLPGAQASVVLVPADCSDLFLAALWARPEAYLDPEVRRGTSPWHQVPVEAADRGLRRLRADLADGTWDQRYGHLRRMADLDVGLRLVTTS